MSVNFVLEWSATLLSLAFLVGLIQRKVWAWPAGIVGSALSVALFLRIGLYAEMGLYTVYVIMGFYGWTQWSAHASSDQVDLVNLHPKIQRLAWLGLPMAALLGWSLNQLPGVSYAYFDALTTVFGLVGHLARNPPYPHRFSLLDSVEYCLRRALWHEGTLGLRSLDGHIFYHERDRIYTMARINQLF
jgi:nicotinamide riboside transporter PnuC